MNKRLYIKQRNDIEIHIVEIQSKPVTEKKINKNFNIFWNFSNNWHSKTDLQRKHITRNT